MLEALGFRSMRLSRRWSGALETAGIVFMYAPLMHPAMRHVGPIRRELGNSHGDERRRPLANPAGAARQVVGVADAYRVPILAGALAELDSKHVDGRPWRTRSRRDLAARTTHVVEIKRRRRQGMDDRAGDFGIRYRATRAELAGGDPAENARNNRASPVGRRDGQLASAVVLNAAAAIYVSGGAKDLRGRSRVDARRRCEQGKGGNARWNDFALLIGQRPASSASSRRRRFPGS